MCISSASFLHFSRLPIDSSEKILFEKHLNNKTFFGDSQFDKLHHKALDSQCLYHEKIQRIFNAFVNKSHAATIYPEDLSNQGFHLTGVKFNCMENYLLIYGKNLRFAAVKLCKLGEIVSEESKLTIFRKTMTKTVVLSSAIILDPACTIAYLNLLDMAEMSGKNIFVLGKERSEEYLRGKILEYRDNWEENKKLSEQAEKDLIPCQVTQEENAKISQWKREQIRPSSRNDYTEKQYKQQLDIEKSFFILGENLNSIAIECCQLGGSLSENETASIFDVVVSKEFLFKAAIYFNPDCATAYFNLGLLISAEDLMILPNNTWMTKQHFFLKTIILDKNHFEAHFELAKTLKSDHETLKVNNNQMNRRELYLKCLELNPNSFKVYNNLSCIIQGGEKIEFPNGELMDKRALLFKAIEIDNTQPILYFNLALAVSDLIERQELILKAIDLDPSNHRFYRRLSLTLTNDTDTIELKDGRTMTKLMLFNFALN